MAPFLNMLSCPLACCILIDLLVVTLGSIPDYTITLIVLLLQVGDFSVNLGI